MVSSAAARTRVVDTAQEPSSAGSVTRTPRVAPIASALRIVSGARRPGAIDRRVTSPSPAASIELERRLERVLVVAVDDGRAGRPVEAAVRAEALAAGRRIRYGFGQDDDAHER